MPIVLYGLPMSCPYRAVLLTARAVGVDVLEQTLDMQDKQEHKSEKYLKMNPTHCIPTLDDNGFYMWESRAIMGYLVQQYAKDDKLYPEEPKKRAVVDNMLYFDATALFASLQHYFYHVIRPGATEDLVARSRVFENLGFLETILRDRKYAAGDQLTIADFSIISSLSLVEMFGFNYDGFPNIDKWSARIMSDVPFYEEATKEGIDKLKRFITTNFMK